MSSSHKLYWSSIALLLSVVGCSVCNDSGKFTNPIYSNHELGVMADLNAANVVFVGTVKTLGAPPDAWGGGTLGSAVVRQSVTYNIGSSGSLKGTASGTVTVAHLVVKGSPNAASIPGLNPTIFAPGKKIIVMANGSNGNFEDFDADYGTIPADENGHNEGRVRCLLGTTQPHVALWLPLGGFALPFGGRSPTNRA